MLIKNRTFFLLISLLLIGTLPALAQKKFSFFAIGDMPYHNPEDIVKFKKLTQALNGEKTAFTVHVGDIKNGKTECSDQYFRMIRDLFNQFKAPLIYTPGDNEWTDCARPSCGGYDPAERLDALRKIFFKNDQSLGQKPLNLRSQHTSPGFEEFVENVMWRKEGITFATLHVVGSNNNLKVQGENTNEEFLKRDEANLHWLSEIFKNARAHNDVAIVIVMQAAMTYAHNVQNGFTNIVEKLRTEVKSFEKPVLVIYGDHHRFQISKPLTDPDENLIQNFTALMVFGDSDMNAVKIDVDPKSKQVFSFSEFLIAY